MPANLVGAEARPGRRARRRQRFTIANLRRDPVGVFAALKREQGDVARARFGRSAFFLVSHPDLIKRVLVSHERDYVRDMYAHKSWRKTPRFMEPSGLLQPYSDPDAHLRARRALQPLFRRARVDAQWPELVRLARTGASQWRDGTTIDVVAATSPLVLALVTEVQFGQSEDLPIPQLVADLRLCVDSMIEMTSGRHELAARLQLRRLARLDEARTRVFAVLTGMLDEARSDSGKEGLPGALLRLAESEDLTDDELLLEAYGHMVNSADTSISTLCWVLYLLSEHPAALGRVREELDAGADAGPEGPSPTDLPFTRAVIAETIRLFPPTWRIKRRALVDHELGGRRVRRGDRVWICPSLVHHDERWWPDADRFVPERWLGSRARPAPFTYVPFGAGPRKCLGEQIAWRELTANLLAVLERWDFSLPPGAAVIPAAKATIRPRGGLRVQIRQRERVPA